MDSLAENYICVVGPLKAQNELLSFFLMQKTGAECEVREHFWDVQLKDNSQNSRPCLILWDCFTDKCKTFSIVSEFNNNDIFAFCIRTRHADVENVADVGN